MAPSRRRALERQVEATGSRDLGGTFRLLEVPAGSVTGAIRALSGEPDVRAAEPNYLAAESATPNDQSFGLQWALRNTGQAVNGTSGTAGADENATKAWSLATGSRSVVIAELDTGVNYKHPDLAPNIWSNPGGVGGCPAGTHGYNVLLGTCDPMDDDAVYGGHGTHVAGIMGAAGNNKIGVAGVNWKTSILPVKWVYGAGYGTSADLISGLNWILQAKKSGVNVQVVNDSDVFFGDAYSQALSDQIDTLGNNGILFVTAAGNTSDNNDDPSVRRYPCGYDRPNEICVTASDQNDQLPGYANYGPATVDLAAPGDNIYSTLRNGQYGYLSGGSMASPQVAGAAALIASVNRNLTPAQLKTTILEHVDPVPALAGLVRTGGRLNVCNAIPQCAPSTPDPSPFNISVPVLTPTASAPQTPSPEPQVGQAVSTSTGSWDHSPSTFDYQWTACDATVTICAPIDGATSANYVPVSSDVGSTLQAVVTATNAAGSTTAVSVPSQVVQPAAPPQTFGKTTVGASLDAGDADYTRVDAVATDQASAVSKLTIYLERAKSGQQVLRGVIYADNRGSPGALIATSAETTFGAAATSGWYDLGFAAAVTLQPGRYWIGLLTGQTSDVFALRYDNATTNAGAVTASPYSQGAANPFGSARLQTEQISIYATYGPTAPPAAPTNQTPPVVTGTATRGSTLTTSNGVWANGPTTYAYGWQRCDSSGAACVAVDGATSNTYVTVSSDIGSALRAVVTATNAAGSTTAVSAATPVVTGTATSRSVGVTTVGPQADRMLADRKRVNAFPLSAAGSVTKLSMYLEPTSTVGSQQVRGVLYADSAGSPGGLLGASDPITFSSSGPAGWYDLTFPSAVALTPGSYWIGVLSGATSYVAGFRWTTVGGARSYNYNSYATGPTALFGSAPSVDSEEMSIYATVVQAG